MSTTKKTTLKAACALALSGALALAFAPAAFAAPPSEGADTPTAFTGNSGDTKVKVATDAGQLSAEVPLNMKVVASPAGGAITAPDASAYQIKNNSYFKIYVTDVKATANTSAGWAYSATTTGAITATGVTGDIHLAITPASGTKHEVSAAGGEKPNWEIAAAEDANGKTLGLAVTGATSPLKKSIGDAGELAVTLTYTIAAAPAE